jgi:hypothetical protein
MPFMSAFWDVLLADILSLAKFATLTLAVVAPAAGIVAALRAYSNKLLNRRVVTVTRATLRGASVGLLAALVVGMLVENLATILIVALTVAAFASSIAIDRRLDQQRSPVQRRPRFTLRQLLAAHLIVAVLIVWWGSTRQERIEQRRVALDWQRRQTEAELVFHPYWFRVQASQTGDSIRLLGPGWNGNQLVDDEGLRRIARHANVTTLDVTSNAIGDEGLFHLAEATQLKELHINSNQITNAGVESLCALPNIETLSIDSQNITPAVLHDLAKVKSLKVLQLGNTQVRELDAADFRNSRPNVKLIFWQWSRPLTTSAAGSSSP